MASDSPNLFRSDNSANTVENGNVIDPLLEQMRSILSLGQQSTTTNQRRQRRFSDADLEAMTAPASSIPIAIRSKDGSRWLPAPAEQSHRVGLGHPACSQIEPRSSKPMVKHVCEADVCAVSKVFATTELLELVLNFLETKDVLSLRQTNRHWNSTVQESPQLRLHFFTYAQWCRPGAQFQLLPLSIPGLTIETGKEIHLGQWINISITAEAAHRISPEPKSSKRVRSRSIYEGLRGGLGSRTQNSGNAWPACQSTPTISSTVQYEDLFITQPPTLSMQAFITYPRTPADDAAQRDEGRKIATGSETQAPACAKLASAAGITLGFLAETTQSLLAAQKAGPSNLDSARVFYKAIMSFCTPEEGPPRKRKDVRTVTRI